MAKEMNREQWADMAKKMNREQWLEAAVAKLAPFFEAREGGRHGQEDDRGEGADMAKKMNREQWLEAAVAKLAPFFEAIGTEIPADVRVSVGWPGGGGRKSNIIGQCWSSKVSTDGSRHIFISPVLDDPIKVLATLVHELVHAVDDCESGHRGGFAKMAKRLGLEGKMTATVAGPALAEGLAGVAKKLGDYPHAALRPGPGKQSTTRMLKVECPRTGYKLRMTRSWIDQLGTPKCPCCGRDMEEA